MANVSNKTKVILELERSMKQPLPLQQKIAYDQLLSDVIKGLPELPPEVASSFETGARGHAVEKLAYYMTLQKVPGLNVLQDIAREYQTLEAAYIGHLPAGAEPADFAIRDLDAIAVVVDKHLGPTPGKTGHFASPDEIKAEARKRYPNLEELGLQFSELFPKPFRSSLIEPMLLQRVPGLDAKKELHNAATALTLAYNEVPKKGGGMVEQVQAAEIAKTARRITGEVLDDMLGKQILR